MINQQILKHLFYYDGKTLRWAIDKGRNAKAGSAPLSLNDDGYCHIYINGKSYKTHRLVFLYHHGYLPKQLDHINGVKDDNRIENLRECTLSQNGRNRGKNKNSTSGYKGVSWFKQTGKWRARSCNDNGRVSLGLYSNPLLAASVVAQYEKDNHGEFACVKP